MKHIGNQQQKGGNGNGHASRVAAEPAKNGSDARSQRPIFTGQRLVVHEWMLTDCINALGAHTDAFDLHEWFFTLDARCVKDGTIVKKKDGGVWLQEQLVAEAQRRNLPLKFATTPSDKLSEDDKWREVARLGPMKRDYAK